MKSYRVKFLPSGSETTVSGGTTVYDAAISAGINLRGECGGQGSCGQCVVKVEAGDCPSGSHPKISREKERLGYRPACKSRVLSDCVIYVPEETLLPSLDVDYSAVVLVEDDKKRERALSDIVPAPAARGGAGEQPPVGLAIDLGTTTVVAELVDLRNGRCIARGAAYNRQLSCGADIISRIGYAARPGGEDKQRELAVQTVGGILERLLKNSGMDPARIDLAAIAGNTTMMHLFLGLDPAGIRAAAGDSVRTRYDETTARAVRLDVNPEARVLFAPGIGSYVGGDVLAGVMACGMDRFEEITLFIDAGTNGEIVLGNRDWMMGCACSTGPAFEGVGISCGMMAAPGAVEAVRIESMDRPPALTVIGGVTPRGLCGSGMIDLMAELFNRRILDRNGVLNPASGCPRLKARKGRAAYIVREAGEEGAAKDIYLDDVDFKKLLRTKAAIQAAIKTLLCSVDLRARDIRRVVIAGRLGEAINASNAVSIGMLPSLPLERFDYIGNGSLWGANMMLLSREKLDEINALPRRMTYLDLGAHPGYMEEYVASLFIPHTDGL